MSMRKDSSSSSKDAAPAENTKVNAPRVKRITAMLKERWGGDQWMYNWGIQKNTNKIKNPVEGKFLADLDWMRIIVNLVDGSGFCTDSKRLQDLGASNVTLDEIYGILVVIYACKLTPREGLASIPKNDHDGGLSENMDDTCSESTMTGGNVSECTDELAYMYEWEDTAARDLGLRTCAASPTVGSGRAIIPRCLVFRPKNIIVRKSSRWPSSSMQWYHVGPRCLATPKRWTP